jgi:hypothetical protein
MQVAECTNCSLANRKLQSLAEFSLGFGKSERHGGPKTINYQMAFDFVGALSSLSDSMCGWTAG